MSAFGKGNIIFRNLQYAFLFAFTYKYCTVRASYIYAEYDVTSWSLNQPAGKIACCVQGLP
jgi:hypothetical protein